MDVKRDGLGDQLLNLFTALAEGDAPCKVRNVRTPSLSIVLDNYHVLSHAIPFSTRRPAVRSRPAYPWAPVVELASHSHSSGAIRITKLAMRTFLSVEAPPLPTQDLDHL